MDTRTWSLLIGLIIALVPLIPAILLFKVVPSRAVGNGRFGGMSWKLGGGFAGYAFVALLLLFYFRTVSDIDTRLWRIQGQVVLDPVAPGGRAVELRTIPDRFQVDSSGAFVLTLALREEAEGELDFPALVAQGADGYANRTVLLRNDLGFRGAAAPKIEIDRRKRLVRITEPIVMSRSPEIPK